MCATINIMQISKEMLLSCGHDRCEAISFALSYDIQTTAAQTAQIYILR